MYRYLLFAYLDYYPIGGMGDCVYKTNSFEDMMSTVQEYIKFKDKLCWDDMSYYDFAEDKYYDAIFEFYSTEDDSYARRFSTWSISEEVK